MAADGNGGKRRFTHIEGTVFHTTCNILYDDTTDHSRDFEQLFRDIDGSLSMFNDTSILSRINRGDEKDKDGQRYAHTINPHTGYPVQQDVLSATVFAPDCMTADAYATAFMVMGSEEALKIAKATPSIKVYLILSPTAGSSQYRTVCSPSL